MGKSTGPSFIMYSACSVDGFIAREDGSVDRLSGYDPASAWYGEFFDTVDGLVMGAKTYEQILTFGDWPYGDKPCLVLSNVARKCVRGCIGFFAGKVEDAVGLMRERKLSRVWIVGGSSTFTQFHRKGLIDDYIITIIPTILGSGIPLFRACDIEVRLRLVSSRALDSGMVLNHHRKI